jgi:hypothetical protein
MSYRSLAVLGISIVLVSGSARAQDEDAPVKRGKKADKKNEAGWADEASATDKADKAKDDDAEAPSAKSAKGRDDAAETAIPKADEPDKAEPPLAEAPPAAPAGTPERAPIYGKRADWNITPYGYARLDIIEDSTESFADGVQPNLIARVGTYRGDHTRSLMTAKDSRLGFFVGAPTFQGIRSSAQIEFDFYGLVPSDARTNDGIIFGTPRIRQAFLKFETPILDVVAGQTWDLFGWGSSYFPATVGYLGVPAEIYHRDPQLRLEKTLHLGPADLKMAVAAVKAGERDSGVPDGQAGIKLSFNGWKGAAIPGFSRPVLAPLSIGVSGLYRHFTVPSFILNPGSETATANGYGLAVQLFAPIIPAKSIEDHGNALTLSAEFSIGSGIADMYTGMDGGSRFPTLPAPSGQPAIYYYQADADPGLVTFDQNSDLKTITWDAVVANLQYYLPIGGGRVWLSGTYSRTWSPNLLELTPFESWGAIFTKMEYIDGNIGFDITPSIVLALSFQTVAQTYGDVTSPTPTYVAQPSVQSPNSTVVPDAAGTGGDAVIARNNRGQISLALFF